MSWASRIDLKDVGTYCDAALICRGVVWRVVRRVVRIVVWRVIGRVVRGIVRGIVGRIMRPVSRSGWLFI